MASKRTRETTKTYFRDRMNAQGFDTLQELSDATGINRGNLYRYITLETRPSIDVVPVLCNALDLTADELLQALHVKGF